TAQGEPKFFPFARIFFQLWLHDSVRDKGKVPGHLLVRLGGAFENKRAEDKAIHFRVDKAAVSIFGSADNRLAAHIEGCIHEHAATGGTLEGFEQSVEEWILLGRNGLNSRGIIDVGHSRNGGSNVV